MPKPRVEPVLAARLLGASAAMAMAMAMTLAAAPASAAAPTPDPLEARTMALAAELRCLVCQNQTIADSHAELAVDLRNQVREQLSAGRTEQEVIDHLTARYGDFVRYRPPVKGTTVLLWAGPALLFAGALGGLAVALRRRQRAAPEAFEALPEDTDGTDDRGDPTDRDAPMEPAR